MKDDTYRLLQLVEEADLKDHSNIQKLIQSAAIIDSPHLADRLKKLLAVKASQRQLHPFNTEQGNPVPVPMGKQAIFGTTKTGGLYTIEQDQLTKHLLAVGQSGSGKTTLFYNLMNQLGVPFWSFDLKQDYRHLIQDRDDLLILPWSELRFNPLKPPTGVKPRRWSQVFSEIFGHSTALLSGSKNYLMQKIIELYKLYNIFNEISEPYPSLHELQMLIREDKLNYVRKASNYRDTLLNRLEAMNLVAGTIFDCSSGYPIEDLLQQNVVFEFDGLSRDVQNFLMEILFAYVYEFRLANNQRGEGLNHVFFLDEGKRIFSVYKERREASGIPEIDELTAKMREFGEGLIVADQEASKLTDSIKANTYTKVLLPIGDSKQFQSMTEAMNLSDLQKNYAGKLDIGEAIIQVGNSESVPVKLRDYILEKDVSDRELQKEMTEKWDSLSFDPRETIARFDEVITLGKSTEIEEKEIVDDPTEKIELSNEAKQLLRDVVENPFKPLTKRYTEFKNEVKGNNAKDEVLESGIIIERRINKEDRKLKLLDLTDKGWEFVENQLELSVDWPGKGDIVHRYWQKRIKQFFQEAGWTAELEVFDADVYVNMDKIELIIEIAMGNNQREIDHVKKHLDNGFDFVWIVARNENILEGLKKRIDETSLSQERLSFKLVSDFKNPENTELTGLN